MRGNFSNKNHREDRAPFYKSRGGGASNSFTWTERDDKFCDSDGRPLRFLRQNE